MMFLGKNSKGRRRNDRGTPVLFPLPSLLQWSSSALKDGRSEDGGKSRREKNTDRCSYRCQLEEEVQKLQKQLQGEINLHISLTNATRHKTTQTFSSCNLPDKVRELLSTIASLETVVTRLEMELVSLHLCLNQERSERHFAECHLMEPPSLSHSSPPCSSDYPWEAIVAPSTGSHFSWEPSCSQTDMFSENGPSPSNAAHRSEKSNTGLQEEVASCSFASNEKELGVDSLKSDDDLKINFQSLWKHPNKLSEEMVTCMRNIYLRLSKSSILYSKDGICHPTSPPRHLSSSSLATFSGSSEFDLCHDYIELESTEDPYRVNWKENQTPIGAYSSAAEVSWMTVGRKQLEYAAEALKSFRFLVEQLEKVNPASLSCDQRLAFWINLYNALIMHAYLAYGVPRSETKLFSLMQKASYTVGGQSVSAVDIEYVLLKMKPPAHRQQIALILALHKFKSFEEHQKISVDASESLVLFALSCGMQSSPAVRIFTPINIKEQLQNSLRDYVRASVGINDKGKLLIPRLLHFFANGVVEDSLLVDWVCRFLSLEQVSAIRGSTTQWKQRLLRVRSFIILPFDSRFRYLFLPEAVSSKRSSYPNDYQTSLS